MLIAGLNMKKIIDLKAHMDRTLKLKDLEETNQLPWIKVHEDKKFSNILLRNKSYIENIL